MDPADRLLQEQLRKDPEGAKYVEFGGRYGFASLPLSVYKPDSRFEVRSDLSAAIQRGKELANPESRSQISFKHVPDLLAGAVGDDDENIVAFIIRNVFWNWSDNSILSLLGKVVLVLRRNPTARILVTDSLSPLSSSFPPQTEIAYRRRDITMMAMHNVKQRTNDEWIALFRQVDADMEVGGVVVY
jgi:hypothetical protein